MRFLFSTNYKVQKKGRGTKMRGMTHAEASTALYQISKSLDVIDGARKETLIRPHIYEGPDILTLAMENSDCKREIYFLTAMRHLGILDSFRAYLDDAEALRKKNIKKYYALQWMKIILLSIISMGFVILIDPVNEKQIGWALMIVLTWILGMIIPANNLLRDTDHYDDEFSLNVTSKDDEYDDVLNDEDDEYPDEVDDDVVTYVRDLKMRRYGIYDVPYYYQYPHIACETALYYGTILDNPVINVSWTDRRYHNEEEYVRMEELVCDIFHIERHPVSVDEE